MFTLAVTDATSGASFTQNTQCASNLTCQVNTAEYIAERVGTGSNAYADMAQWTNPVEFYNAESAIDNGTPEPIYWWDNEDVEMVNSSSNVLAIVSALESQGALSSGNSFFDKWLRDS